ncbi:hypothetical protein [Methanobrevibacter sp.]|uniref:hypothetical protein n=1 Tax=Methanobrevibacter sp. TaxID=66852 RepID=UPI0038667E57
MVEINYCPSCGSELLKGSFICPSCNLDIEELFAKGYLLASNELDNSIELFDGNLGNVIMDDVDSMDEKINFKSGDEIVIVIPEGADEDEIVIDLDALGIDVENLDDDVNIIIQVEGAEEVEEDILDDEDYLDEPNEWYFDDDPYGIVYYEFPEEDDD